MHGPSILYNPDWLLLREDEDEAFDDSYNDERYKISDFSFYQENFLRGLDAFQKFRENLELAKKN